MKKTRILALVLCVSVMLMGAGYAYWTDTLTINSTVSTGELNVDFTGCSLTTSDPYLTITGVNDTSAELDAVNFGIENLYPGASATLNLRMENTGTIPAVLHRFNVVFDNAGMPSGLTLLSAADQAKIEIVGGTVGVKINGATASATIDQIKNYFHLSTYPNITQLTTLMNYFEPTGTLRLEPGDYIDLSGLVIQLNGPNTTETAENSFVHMGITMDFQQHNAPIVNP